jgi:hypothetical protein
MVNGSKGDKAMQIKKFLATGLSAVMAGATLAGGVLADHPLSDYPDFLGNNGQLDVLVVVGADAQPADIVGAGDVVAGLSSLSYVMVDSEGGSTTVGGTTEEMDLGTALNATDGFGATIDEDDVSGFFDGEVSISIGGTSDTYDAHDELRLGDGALGTIKVQTGLTAASPDEEFGDDVFLEALTNSIEYRYVFDENLNNGNMIANATNADPITLNFLGRDLIITGATASTITVDTGERFILKAGESATTSDGKTVTLEKAIDSDEAQITVNGQTNIVSENSVKNIGGTEVKVTDVADDDGIEFDSATVIVGTEATGGEASDTYSDGDEFVIPCGTQWMSDGCDIDDGDWVWNLSGLTQGTAGTIVMGVIFDERIDSPEDNPPTVDGENNALDLPGGFAWISLDRLTTTNYQQYEMTERVKDLKHGSGGVFANSAHVLEINGAGDDDSFIISVNGTNEDTDNIYLYVNDTASVAAGDSNDTLLVFYEDPDDSNKIKYVTEIGTPTTFATTSANLAQADFEQGNVQLAVSLNRDKLDGATNFTINLLPDSNSAVAARNLSFYVEESSTAGQINYVGDSDSDTSTANDIRYNVSAQSSVSSIDISGYEEDTMTADGIIVNNPDGNAPSDKYIFQVPSEYGTNDFQVVITIGSSGTTTTTTSSGGIKQLVPITESITMLDTEVDPDSVDTSLVLVGGPAVNRLTAEAMGKPYPSFGAASGIPENAAWISIIDDAFTTGKVAVVVAGWEADNTRLATSVLQQAATKLAGVSASSATVTGTSVASAVITPA